MLDQLAAVAFCRYVQGARLEFQLIASGNFFDVDGFLATTTLGYQRVFRRRDNNVQFSSGFTRVIGNAAELTFDQQVHLAVRFIEEHKSELKRLMTWPGVTKVEVILSPALELARNIVCTQCYSVPPSLVQACASLGLSVGIAVRVKWPNEI